jgi:uncharacterized damage-inducible protein DinB
VPIIDGILSELDHESKATRRILQRVPSEQLSWAPHAKSSSLGRLAFHIASIPSIALRFLRAGTFDVTQARPPQPFPATAEEIVAAFEHNLAELRATLAPLSDEELRQTFTMMKGDAVVMSIPKIGMLRTILLNHTYHHRGQLSVYLRLLDISVPVVYGSTADEAI